VTAQAGVDNARMQHEGGNSSGGIHARVELLREQHIGQLAVVVVPAQPAVNRSSLALSAQVALALRTETARSPPLLVEGPAAKALRGSRLRCC
jgi:hypothetical protein